ncbi:ABC transporter substrate-binding protein [Alpinimonas psychrophila]|uniref:Peptide/nickel transport system substrate-binding protein n=1 Tax=Alpinimonas psychrophila TaxID=748908 RepID=A0A7W3JTG2_9MICO|nr:ABC transporter substrate-binding protein [Alpinimonas psychrophila]MBA8828939.1 peptide/nickel transport system substrate-binding protein [Alpinimonas psychrophila]
MKFRSPISIAAGVALAVSLVGCSTAGGPTKPDASEGLCTSTPVAGGSITVAKQTETLSLSPYSTPGGFGDTEALNMIFETLIRMDPTGNSQDLVSGVADTWSTSADGLAYTFHIRDGATFSNGRHVMADDVKYSLDSWSDPDVSQWASFARGYDSTTVVDDSTVKINMTEPIGGFLYSLAMVSAGILPQEEAKAAGDSFFDSPIGSGPFAVDKWVKGSSISFVKNDWYWDTSGPLLDSVEFRFVSDDNNRTLALRSGDVQMVDNVPWSQVKTLQSEASLTIEEFAIPSWILLSLNNQKGPFADQNVRQALSLAIDREGVNEKIYFGMGEAPNSILPRLRLDADASTIAPTAFDLNKAKELIAASKYPNGFEATLEYPSGNAAFDSLAVVLQAYWAELGVTIELLPEDQGTLSKNFTGGTYDIMLPYSFAASDVPVPDEFAEFYAVQGGTNGFFTWWNDPEIEALVLDFTGTVGDEERAAKWPAIQAAMLEAQPAINVLNLPLVNGHLNNVCGFSTNPIGQSTFTTTWIAG